jgi:hypothetical protein
MRFLFFEHKAFWVLMFVALVFLFACPNATKAESWQAFVAGAISKNSYAATLLSVPPA